MGPLNIRTGFDVVTGREPDDDASAWVAGIPARRDLSVLRRVGAALPTNRGPGTGAVCFAACPCRICVGGRTAREQWHPAAALLNQTSDVPSIP